MLRSICVLVSVVAALSGLITVHADEHYDLVVYGGTPAGIAAAVTAARGGAAVVMIEPTQWVGGMVTGGLAKSDVGNEKVIGGFAREFFARAAAAKPGTPLWYAEPHVNLATFEQMLAEAKVTVIKAQSLVSIAREGARISSLTLADGRTFAGRVFVDATYEGDLMARAGVAYIVGRESSDRYGEPLAGFHPMPIRPRSAAVMGDTCACIGGTGPHYIHGTPTAISGRDAADRPIFGVVETKAQPGTADGLTQAYNFRIVVTRAADRVPFPKPATYDPAHYELLARLLAAFPGTRFGRLFHLGAIAGEKYDLNAQGFFSTDYPGANTAYPDGDAATRARIWDDHRDFNQGLLWFLGHDERVPAALRAETSEWGLARDEFAENAHWPYALYVREGRRMIGDHVLVQKDLQSEVTKPDSIGMGSFVIDCHIVQRILLPDGTVTDEGSFQDAPVRPYQIPYRCLTPKPAECENLLVPVCLSASHIACCSLRMEPQYMACGQASGVAASLALERKCAVQAIDVAALQTRLREQAAVLEIPLAPELARLGGLVLDDEAGEFVGSWTSSSFGTPLGVGSRHDENAGKGEKTARFRFQVKSAGRYEVRFAYIASANRASNVPLTIEHADGRSAAVVNEKLPPPIDGHFISLGTFSFAPDQPAIVTVSNAGTDGFVAIDAVQLLPAP